jgi:hypothetical protein
MGGAIVMDVPVHGERRRAHELGPVHPDVVRPRPRFIAIAGMNRVHAGQGDVPPFPRGCASLRSVDRPPHGGRITIKRPALDQWEPPQVNLPPGSEAYFVLTDAPAHQLGRRSEHRGEGPHAASQVTQAPRGLKTRQGLDSRGKPLQTSVFTSHRPLNAVIGAKDIHDQREVAPIDLLEVENAAAQVRRLLIHDASPCSKRRTSGLSHRQRSNFQKRRHRVRNAMQVSCLIEVGQKGL